MKIINQFITIGMLFNLGRCLACGLFPFPTLDKAVASGDILQVISGAGTAQQGRMVRFLNSFGSTEEFITFSPVGLAPGMTLTQTAGGNTDATGCRFAAQNDKKNQTHILCPGVTISITPTAAGTVDVPTGNTDGYAHNVVTSATCPTTQDHVGDAPLTQFSFGGSFTIGKGKCVSIERVVQSATAITRVSHATTSCVCYKDVGGGYCDITSVDKPNL